MKMFLFKERKTMSHLNLNKDTGINKLFGTFKYKTNCRLTTCAFEKRQMTKNNTFLIELLFFVPNVITVFGLDLCVSTSQH